jgi:hypothetical protein
MAKIFSTEDGDLSTSIRVVRERLYSDFDLTFEANTTSGGDVYKKTDAASVKQAIKTLLLTNRFEKPYKPQFGADLNALLFNLADEETGAEISSAIKSAIERYEPRVAIQRLQVSATPDYNSVAVVIEFRVLNTQQVDTLKISVSDQSAGPAIPVELPVTPDQIIDLVILSERESVVTLRTLTEAGAYLIREIGKTVDGAILTQDGDEISFSDGSGNIIIITQGLLI